MQRAKRYECMDHRALLDIPMQKFMAPTGADVAMWVSPVPCSAHVCLHLAACADNSHVLCMLAGAGDAQ